jgi:hypothetical protein
MEIKDLKIDEKLKKELEIFICNSPLSKEQIKELILLLEKMSNYY